LVSLPSFWDDCLNLSVCGENKIEHHSGTADHHHYQTAEDQDNGVEQQVDGDNDEYQEASCIVF